MSEVEFVVLTVLISVGVNDSAPSLGTHYQGEMGEGRREKDVTSVTLRTTENTDRTVTTVFLLFLTSNPILLIPLSS